MARPWLVLAALAAALALAALVRWVQITASGLPVGYGEGAVIHAGQLLARGEDPYAVRATGLVSANYPPLAYAVVAATQALGPFAGLRAANIAAALSIAAAIAWRGRRDRVAAGALAATFLALFPVWLWVPHARVDLLAVALVAAGVLSLDGTRGRGAALGALGALALLAKPTAAVPLAAVLAYLAVRDRGALARAAVAGALVLGAALALLLTRSDPRGVYEHLVVHNAFGYDWRNVAGLLALAALFLGGIVLFAARAARGHVRAYVAGAAGVVLLGGHEGATANYLLDLAAASCLALASGPHARLVPAVLTAHLVATLVLVAGPLAPPPLDAQAARVAVAARVGDGAAPVHAEDSALLIAAGIEPFVDDAYVWARLVERGVRRDELTPLVEARALRAVIADVRLDRLADAPEHVRARWPEPLVRAVLAHYRLDASVPGAYRYVPR